MTFQEDSDKPSGRSWILFASTAKQIAKLDASYLMASSSLSIGQRTVFLSVSQTLPIVKVAARVHPQSPPSPFLCRSTPLIFCHRAFEVQWCLSESFFSEESKTIPCRVEINIRSALFSIANVETKDFGKSCRFRRVEMGRTWMLQSLRNAGELLGRQVIQTGITG